MMPARNLILLSARELGQNPGFHAGVGDDGYLQIMHYFWICFGLGLAGAVAFASFFEWALHRFFMHRPVWRFDYAFRAHALVHHQTFKADHTYHLINEPDKETIPMAWWNGPVLIVVC